MKDAEIIGRLATGIGMGTSFTQLPWAKHQFIKYVGVNPYPGTINVIVDDPESMAVWGRLRQTEGIRLENPNNGPHDCDAKCWLVSIDSKIDGAIVLPLVESYPIAQVEIIAPVCVRDALDIEDGDPVSLFIRN
ncbi:MAG: DUF120 domain-containing protein [Pseudomonadota bacterium]|nr:DUF120 domain-containing protein [Pseudomonadota bacterium]